MDTKRIGRPRTGKMPVFWARLPEVWKEELQAMADHSRMSLNSIVRAIVRDYLDNRKNTKGDE